MTNKPLVKPAGLPAISSAWLVFYLVWPFGALIRALLGFRSPRAKTLFWLFCVFFGFVFVVAEDAPGAADSARIATGLIDAHRNPMSWNYLIASFYNPAGNIVDIYQPLVIWLVALFTDNPRILFALFAVVFGFFYAQNLWMVFSKISKRVGWLLLLFMLAYALTNPIWNINGVRMWTAAQIFLFGILRVYLENDKKGLSWAASSILVHFSFMFPMALLLAFRFIPSNFTVLFAFYVAASFVNELDFAAVREALGFLPEVFQPRIEGYASEAVADARQEAAQGLAWHVNLADMAGRYIRYAWIIALYSLRSQWIRQFPEASRLFAMALFIGGFAQIAALVPSGGRFEIITTLLVWGVIVLLLGQGVFNNKLKPLKLLTFPLLGFGVIFSVRLGMSFFGISALVSNPLIALFYTDQVPLIDFIKGLF